MSKSDITESEIKEVFESIAKNINHEYRKMNQEDLEEKWFFEWSDAVSLEMNIYKFHDCLGLYSSSCRRWEEIHNGHACVVERVRDKYLMPKIREFAQRVREA